MLGWRDGVGPGSGEKGWHPAAGQIPVHGFQSHPQPHQRGQEPAGLTSDPLVVCGAWTGALRVPGARRHREGAAGGSRRRIPAGHGREAPRVSGPALQGLHNYCLAGWGGAGSAAGRLQDGARGTPGTPGHGAAWQDLSPLILAVLALGKPSQESQAGSATAPWHTPPSWLGAQEYFL